jgi:hypothetical protein
LDQKKTVHPDKTNLLFVQDFTGFHGLKNLERCIISNDIFKNIWNNIIIGFYDNVQSDDHPLLYVIGSRMEVFLPETISDAEIIFYFTSADNNRRLHYHMLDQVQKRIAITHQYFIPEWLKIFVFLSKLDTSKPPSKNLFIQKCEIDLQRVDKDLYRRRCIKLVTMFLMIKIKERLKFLNNLGFIETTMYNFYEFCKIVITHPHLCYDMRDKMIICCNNIVKKLWRTNIFTMQLTEMIFPVVIQKIINEYGWINC